MTSHQNPYSAPSTISPKISEEDDLCRRQRWYLYLCLALLWVSGDARLRGWRLGLPMKLGLVLLMIVFIPVYLMRSRGWRQGAVSSLYFMAFLLAQVFASMVGSVFVYLFLLG